MTVRASIVAVSLVASMAAMFCLSMLHAAVNQRKADQAHILVKRLGLSDLALFTEARYTRHPALADLHTAFQDHPASMDHFPTGSLILPPRHLRQHAGRLEVRGNQE